MFLKFFALKRLDIYQIDCKTAVKMFYSMIAGVETRVEIIKLFYTNNDNARVNPTLLFEGQPEQNISVAYVLQLVCKILEMKGGGVKGE